MVKQKEVVDFVESILFRNSPEWRLSGGWCEVKEDEVFKIKRNDVWLYTVIGNVTYGLQEEDGSRQDTSEIHCIVEVKGKDMRLLFGDKRDKAILFVEENCGVEE